MNVNFGMSNQTYFLIDIICSIFRNFANSLKPGEVDKHNSLEIVDYDK